MTLEEKAGELADRIINDNQCFFDKKDIMQTFNEYANFILEKIIDAFKDDLKAEKHGNQKGKK